MKQLLIETISFEPRKIYRAHTSEFRQILSEGVGMVKPTYENALIIEGILQRANALNQNKRKYPSEILVRESKKYNKVIGVGNALGELDHPESQVVEAKNASHRILHMDWQGDDLVGRIEVFNGPDPYGTPAGRIVEALVNRGVPMGISSRGLGSVKELDEGIVEVQDDFELICFDLVTNPSTIGAYLSKPGDNNVAAAQAMQDHYLRENKQFITEVKQNSKYDSINEHLSHIFCDMSGFCECNLTK